MGLHHQSNHGRVLRGLDAMNHLDMHKRDSHGTDVKMNVPKYLLAAARPADAAQTKYGLANKAQADVQTIESVVYVTLSADFTGAIAGYTTLTELAASSTTAAVTSATGASSAAVNDAEASYISAKSAAAARASVTSSATITVSPTSAASTTLPEGHNNKSVFLNAPASATIAGSGVQATRAAHHSSTDNGMTSGAKAGLAIGILMGLALAGGLLFFCWRRRKNPSSHEEILNEKRASSTFGGKNMSEKRGSDNSGRSSHAASTAPRLSLRPVTQFLPSMATNRKSASSVVDATSEKPKSMWERRANPAENPFGDAAVSSENEPQNPFDEPEGTDAAMSQSAQLGTASAVAVTPAAAAKDVHRVQLDFKPSMEDELELKSGQLVRMLHEYDDGWALCMRMDRSQQGVAPRTCLSKLSVKPRPQSPPSSDAAPTSLDQASNNVGVERPSTPADIAVPTRKPVSDQTL